MFEPCACLGPKLGEEYCMCKMINLGRKTKKDYEMSPEEKQKMNDAFANIFSWRREKKRAIIDSHQLGETKCQNPAKQFTSNPCATI